ncbi:hexameric tyrosine-coordinated heme protein [Paracoccus pantotrophus]|uniref:hexameric tyrosine-coordinated heme protein n=1 Tax=Paracoccus pantotrophus TaxID=82367 RepID=UPI0008E4F9DB|nr:hexameric tyrosine-coordinated heme protein [Paracoccus pantotrophus]MDF3855656.1 hexameric tyrosine-coordinated heme protein [Paracoccus pantotrophus]SFO79224.1 Hexameric tyrosine-coordinated heme protein (HTHP) [Paracoccus pantotrophus]
MFRSSCILAASLALLPPASLAQTGQSATGAAVAETWLPTLQVDTPQQGFDLAIVMARRAVKTTQPDVAALRAGRPGYAADAGRLIDVSAVAAAWFATIAAANDYWRE